MTLGVSAVADLTAGPRAVVTVSGLTGTTGHTWTLTRSVSGTVAPVRSAHDMPVLGVSAVVDDWECPFSAASYTVTEYDGSGGTVASALYNFTGLTAVTVPWISDPLSPAVACAISLQGDALTSLTYAQDGALATPLGDPVPVALVQTRRAGSGIPLPILCLTLGARVSAMAVLMSAAVVCLRTPDTDGYAMLPRLAYVAGPAGESPQTMRVGGQATIIGWTGTLVRPPAADIAVPTRTYNDVLAEASTYGDVQSQHATYLGLLRGTAS